MKCLRNNIGGMMGDTREAFHGQNYGDPFRWLQGRPSHHINYAIPPTTYLRHNCDTRAINITNVEYTTCMWNTIYIAKELHNPAWVTSCVHGGHLSSMYTCQKSIHFVDWQWKMQGRPSHHINYARPLEHKTDTHTCTVKPYVVSKGIS